MGYRITHQWGAKIYKPGDPWYVCDRCGFDYRLSETVIEENTGLRVCRNECYDPVHPRDDVNRDLDKDGNTAIDNIRR